MAKYGILRSATNTGQDSELIAVFAAPLSINSNRPSLINDTLTLKRKASYSDIQRWEIETALVPFENPSEFLVQNVAAGYSEPFFIRMPQIYRSEKISQTLAPKVFAAVSAGNTTVNITNAGAGLPVGEFIKFAGHSKVYIVKASTSIGGSVNQLTIFPKLSKSIALNESVLYGDKVSMAAMYGDDSKIGISYIDGILSQVDSITLIEVL